MASFGNRPAFQRVSNPGTSPDENDIHNKTRFVIGVDFGTTYTGVSWILTTGRQTESAEHIYPVSNWPGAAGKKIVPKVPSEYTYSATSGTAWGYGIDDSEYVIRWMKLQLQPPSSRHDALQTLVQNLKDVPLLARLGERRDDHRPLPTHLIREPVDVVTDYMVEVGGCVVESIKAERHESTLDDHPIDLVITHPAEWPETAINLTVRAIVEGFATAFSGVRGGLGARWRKVLLATEPEACAQLTMSDASKDKTANLRLGDCFVIVDAGGGTVDVVSCRVESISPFRIVPVTKPASGRYGSTYVDRYFLNEFLPRHLVGIDYHNVMYDPDRHRQGAHRVLRPAEQTFLDKFQIIKHEFKGRSSPDEDVPDQPIILPANVRVKPGRGPDDGHLRVTCEDFEEMFKWSVDGTLRLIEAQIGQLALRRERFRTILLSGGFSENEYLFRRVHAHARAATVMRAKDSWTAVAKGAVLLGLGLNCDMPVPAVRCPYHIGAVLSTRYNKFTHDRGQLYEDSLEPAADRERAKNHIHWVISKGDLVNPPRHGHRDAGIHKVVPITRRITRDGSKSGHVRVIASSSDKERDLPRVYDPRRGDRKSLAVELNFDLQEAFDKFQATVRYNYRSTGLVEFARVQMQLDVTVIPGEIVFRLGISSQQEALQDPRVPDVVMLDEHKINYDYESS